MLAQRKSTWRSYPPVPAREDCTICQGTGWELTPSSGSSRARRCPCVALTRAVKLRDLIRLPQRYEHCALERYRPQTLSQTHALAEAWKFAERFPQIERGLIFVGGQGVGKTHLAVGIALELLQRFQEDSLFVDFQSLPGLRWSVGGSAAEGDPGTVRLSAVSLLIVDNLGADSSTRNQYQAALQIIQARMRARKPTLCTSAGLEELDAAPNIPAKSAGRIRSAFFSEVCRMHALIFGGFKIVRMTGENYRKMESSHSSLF
jgi:DNA replication protein DnaC